MSLSAAFYTHAAASLAYAIFVALLAFRSARSWLTALLALAAGLTALWALAWTLYDVDLLPSWIPALLVPIRDGSWLAVILAILRGRGGNQLLWQRLVAITAVIVTLDAVFSAAQLNFGTFAGVQIDYQITRIATAVLGLILVENLMRNITADQFWSVKTLGIGLVTVFAFDLMLRIPQFLTHAPDEGLVAVQPLVFVLVLPLFVVTAVRSPALQLGVHSSRKLVFHSAALVCAGVLLQGTAIAAYYIRNYGGTTATILSVLLVFGTLVALAVATTSGSVRSYLRTFINENFFSYKYDYRIEWQKFIQSLSAWEDGGMPLRVLRTLSELLDSPGGALWSFRERWSQFMPAAQWSLPVELGPIGPADACLQVFEDEKIAYLDLSAANLNEPAKAWRERFPSSWLVVPLRYRAALVGVAVLNPPRARKVLNWEDRNLIALVSMQLAAYLVQEETAQALADARQLEEFNKRIAFILHDIKNTIGQLSLIARNAEQFGHNEEFRKDMVLTIEHSVEKLHELLARLRGEAGAVPAAKATEGTNLTDLIADFVLHKRNLGCNIAMGEFVPPAFVALSDRKAFLNVLEHVVMNAVEATPEGAQVNVRIENGAGRVRVNIDDQGAGMTAQFIAKELFRPLRTTKGKGMGIGAYQAKETMRDLGGDIEVSSKVGMGTTITLLLPSTPSQQQRISA